MPQNRMAGNEKLRFTGRGPPAGGECGAEDLGKIPARLPENCQNNS
jgi:hypothetical protein